MNVSTENEDTIVAAATAAARSGVAVIRISGNNAIDIIKKLSGKTDFTERAATFSPIDTGEVRDEALILYFKKPHSYTGEDVAEIHCHGNPLIVSGIIKYCTENGARLAEAGEFTKRAYLNGKADLTAAEAVADIISAETKMQLDSAARLREGRLFKETESLQSEVYDLIAELNAAIDYPEEDIEEPVAANVKLRAADLAQKLRKLAATYNSGRLIKEGVRVAIFGAPNVGKSSVLNSLLGKDRAIVSPIPGTTRDTVEDRYEYNGIIFIIADTAGIRETEEGIELLGIERAHAAVKDCDIILAVADNQNNWTAVPSDKPILYVRNKIDLVTENAAKNCAATADNGTIIKEINTKGLKKKNNEGRGAADEGGIKAKNGEIIEASALTGQSIDKIKQSLYDISCGELSNEGFVLTNLRHYEAVKAAAGFLDCAVSRAEYETPEIISVELFDAARELGKITGLIGSDEVISRIFSKFCVGK